MRSSRSDISSLLGVVALFLIVVLAGCGDFCIAGFSVNGVGGIKVSAGNPPPPCSLPHVNARMSAVARKLAVCKNCSLALRVEHLFVTLQGIQMCPAARDETVSSTWIEIAPHFVGKPRQMDLIGDADSELLAANVTIPAGSYREVRLKLFSGPPANAEALAPENSCGEMGWNCIVMADGRVEPLRLPNDDSELLLPIHTDAGSGTFVLLPDSRMELQLSLEPRQVSLPSNPGVWKPQIVLAGHATIEPQKSSGIEMITSD